MKRNTEKNREKLALEAAIQMDIEVMMGIIREQLEYQYESYSSKKFNEAWNEIFGEE